VCPTGSSCEPGVDGNTICLAKCGGGGASCRTSEGYACGPDGFCAACVPQCTGKTCGDDGCGGWCGVTDPTIAVCNDAGSVCSRGQCGDGFTSNGSLCCGMSASPSFDYQGVWDAAVFDFDGNALIVGGREVSQYSNGKIESRGVDRVALYDQTMGKVTRLLQKLPVPIARPQAAMIDNVVYIAGGINDPDVPAGNPGTAESAITTVYRQNGAGNWLQLADVPGAFPSESMLVAQGGLLYLIGGSVNGAPSTRVDVYDPKADKWNKPAAPPQRTLARTLFAATSDGNRIYVIGGWDGAKALGTVEIFDPSLGWSKSIDLPAPLVDPRAVVTNGKIYVFGGRAGPNPLSDPYGLVESIDLTTHHTALLGRTPNQLGGQSPVALRDGTVLLFGAFEFNAFGPIAHPEVEQFVIPAP
jgi:N-acetylneuraminic acid mutarotase